MFQTKLSEAQIIGCKRVKLAMVRCNLDKNSQLIISWQWLNVRCNRGIVAEFKVSEGTRAELIGRRFLPKTWMHTYLVWKPSQTSKPWAILLCLSLASGCTTKKQLKIISTEGEEVPPTTENIRDLASSLHFTRTRLVSLAQAEKRTDSREVSCNTITFLMALMQEIFNNTPRN